MFYKYHRKFEPLKTCVRMSKWEMHDDRSKSNACYLISLAHDVRGGCWWYGSRG
jgi:hypothetical protein